MREQSDSEARFEQMQANDRNRAAKHLAREGLTALSDYERKLIGVDSRSSEEAKRARLDRERAQRREDAVTKLRPAHIVFRSAFLERLNDHAIDLVMEHNITVYIQRDGGGSAGCRLRTIHVPPVTNEDAYVTCLHEIGHVVSPEADSCQFRNFVTIINGRTSLVSPDGELGACAFAFANALAWTRAMHDRVYQILSFYASYADNDERARMALFISNAALRIADKPWSFAERDEKCALLRGRDGKDLR